MSVYELNRIIGLLSVNGYRLYSFTLSGGGKSVLEIRGERREKD